MNQKIKAILALLLTIVHCAGEVPIKFCLAISPDNSGNFFGGEIQPPSQFVCDLCDKDYYISEDLKSCVQIIGNNIADCEHHKRVGENLYHCKRCKKGYRVSRNLKKCLKCDIDHCQSCALKDEEVLCKACSLGKVPDDTRKACVEKVNDVEDDNYVATPANCLLFEHYLLNPEIAPELIEDNKMLDENDQSEPLEPSYDISLGESFFSDLVTETLAVGKLHISVCTLCDSGFSLLPDDNIIMKNQSPSLKECIKLEDNCYRAVTNNLTPDAPKTECMVCRYGYSMTDELKCTETIELEDIKSALKKDSEGSPLSFKQLPTTATELESFYQKENVSRII
jgi:hypothetical protein